MQTQTELVERIEQLLQTLKPTPVVRLADNQLELYAKLESVNPIGSIKDRSALWILKRAAERGELVPGATLVESSSGNFALALANLSGLLGLHFVPVIDPNISPMYESLLRLACESVVKVEARDDTGGYLKTRLKRVHELRRASPQVFWPNQYQNLDGVEAHRCLTGEEISQQLSALDYVFVGVSTAATIAGLSQRLKERFPQVRVIAVDAVGSVIFGGPPRSRRIPGIGASIVPKLLSSAHIDDVVMVPETETVDACHQLLSRHGLFVGGSSGTAYAAILRYLPRMKTFGRKPRVLFLCADRGMPYLSTVYNPAWVETLRAEAGLTGATMQTVA